MDDLVASIFAMKEGDQEFILSRDNLGGWFAAIGNKSQSAAIGEQLTYGDDGADFYAEGASAREAFENLSALLTTV